MQDDRMITRRGLGAASLAAALAATAADSWSSTASAAGGAVSAPAELIRIDRDTTVAADVTAGPGSRFEVAAGATLTFTGDLIAPAGPLFAGLGKVDLTRSRVVAARPEWWGAVADDPAVDCGPALHACLAAHLAMQLGAGDYHLAEALRVDRPNRRIWGIGRAKDFRGTRLLRRGGAGPVILVGTAAAPATINAFLWGVDLRWIELGRTEPPHGDAADPATGLQVRHVVDCRFEGLRANEHAIGFSLQGAVRTFLSDCSAFRSVVGSDGRDTFVGFDLDGRHPPAAIATGANASLYIVDGLVRTGNHPRLALSAGCRLTGALSDTFLDRFETTDVGVGILVDGQRAALDAAQRRAGHVDLHIRGAVLDQCGDAGIRLTGLSDEALVDIADPYVALAPTGSAALDLADCGGNIGITGGQMIGWTAPGSAATGLRLRATSGVAVAGTKLVGFARPVDAAASTAFELAVGINYRGPATAEPAIRLAACTHGHIRPRITGTAGVFDCGVAADGACDAIDITTAGIMPSTLANGSPVRVDGHAVAADGPGRIYLAAERGGATPPRP